MLRGQMRVGSCSASVLRPWKQVKDRALRVGLTGGIGSGKSTVASTLHSLVAVVADADAIAREITTLGHPVLTKIIATFGEDVLDSSGHLDRARLAHKIFSQKELRRELEAIMHPVIAARAEEELSKAQIGQIAVYDVPLLVELNMSAQFDLVINVDAPVDVRMERLVHRGISARDAQSRIAAQATLVARRAATNIWIDNSGNLEDLRELTRQVHDTLLLSSI